MTRLVPDPWTDDDDGGDDEEDRAGLLPRE